MKVYTIYQVIKYQTKEGVQKIDLVYKCQTDNREKASLWMERPYKKLNRYISTYNEKNDTYDLKENQNGFCLFVDVIDE